MTDVHNGSKSSRSLRRRSESRRCAGCRTQASSTTAYGTGGRQFVHSRGLGDRDDLVERLTTVHRAGAAILERVAQVYPPMPPDLLERDLTGAEQIDQRRPSDPEEVSDLLGGQPLVDRGDRDGLALGHRRHDFPQHLEPLAWQDMFLAVRSHQLG